MWISSIPVPSRNANGKLSAMPFLWLQAPISAISVAAAQQGKPQIGDFGDELQVTGKVQEFTKDGVATYSDGVVAKFGPTTVMADRLEIHYAEGDKYGIATGHVHLDDPEGNLDAAYIIFWWGPKKGPDGQMAVADSVRLQFDNISAKADYAVVRPERWELYNVEGTNCRRPLPLFAVRSKKLVLVPGKSGTIAKPHLVVLGHDLITLPTRQFSLDRRNPGLQIPAISYRKGAGFGIDWSSGLLLDDQSVLQGHFDTFPRQFPSYSLVYARSFVPADVGTTKITARSELDERFSWSYFDDVRVTKPESSLGLTNRKRNSLTVQSIWNTGSSARLETEHFSKALDVAYERSGPVKGFGLYWQVRGESIRRDDEAFLTRGLAYASLQAPSVQLTKGLSTDVRFDLSGIAGAHGLFGWARAQAGLNYRPIPQLTFGAAYIRAAEAGHPDYVADRLYSKDAAHLRMDVNLGPTKISYLAKYDLNRKNWYDKEYSVSQVVGCLEPFITRREFPRDYVIGVRLRFGNLFDILERRKQTRTKTPPVQQISGPSDKP